MGVPITLPGGYWHEGRCYKQAELRPLAGADEAFLLEEAQVLFPAQRTTILLTRCLDRLGPVQRVTPEAVRSLTVGDREAMLLHLRRLTFGDRLACVLSCPKLDCGERMDLDLRVTDLLLAPDPDRKERYETSLRENGLAYRLTFRLPTGGDLEEVASVAWNDDPDAAADFLLRRCVEHVTPEGDEGRSVEEWPPVVARELPALMAELDPQAELRLNLSCPVCGHRFSTLFDVGDFLFRELGEHSRQLYREVHRLAFYYHWSEKEILSMPPRKRWLYLDLLDEALGGEARL